MIDLTNNDKEFINREYKSFLFNLKEFLNKSKNLNVLDYSKSIINLMHNGRLSMEEKITFSNDYNYITLPPTISQGVHVFLGICCCRHATFLVKDCLDFLGYNSVLFHVFVDGSNCWHQVDPGREKCNHVVVLTDYEGIDYIVDPANKFILKKESDGNLVSLGVESINTSSFHDESIENIGRVLRKYYTYRDLGIEHVYEY